MLEYKRDDAERSTEVSPLSVKVVGIGGAGANVLDRIALEGMDGAELISMNTDVRGLSTSVANSKIQLGRTLTQGLAAGGDPELGQQAAEEAEAEIRAALQNSGMVFICAGLGGGTGSGAAPYIAKIAREEGAFVVAFVTVPFSFEGRRRLQQASDSLRQLEIYANALVTFDNDRMGDLVLPKEGIQQAFTAADQIISQSVRAVTSLVTQPGLIKIGMDDLLTALRNHNSRCLFGFGQAKGENRAQEALARALKSPLLDKGHLLKHAGNAIIQVTGGDSMTLYEVEILMNEVGKHVRDSAQILFGVSADAKLTDSITVTILSSVQEAQLKPPPEGEESAPAAPPAAGTAATPPPAGGGGAPAAEPSAKKSEAPAQVEPERAPVASNPKPAPAAAPAPSLHTMAVPVVAKAAAPAPAPEPKAPPPEEPVVRAAPKSPPDIDPALMETVISEPPREAKEVEVLEGLEDETDTSELDVFVDHDEDEEDASPFVEELTGYEPIFVNPIAEASGTPAAAEEVIEELEILEEAEAEDVFVDPFPAAEEEAAAPAETEPEPEPAAKEPEPEPETKAKGGLSKLASRFRGKSKDKAEEPAREPATPETWAAAELPPKVERPAEVTPGLLPPKRKPGEPVREIPAPAPTAKLPPKPREALPQQDELIPKKPVARGRFEKTEPTIIDGEDLDVPAFLRKKGGK